MKQLMQTPILKIICYVFVLFTITSSEETRHRRSIYNKVTGVYTNCSRSNLQATVKTELNFTGNLYARGYPIECRRRGDGKASTTLSVSPQECGVKIISEENGEHTYELLIYVQFDPLVQQVSDEQVHVTCAIDKARDLHVTGRSSMNVYSDKEMLPSRKDSGSNSTGRSPKVNTFGISDLYPTNILNLPSKLQQMVNEHFKTTLQDSSSTTTVVSTTNSKSGNKIKLETTTEVLQTTLQPEVNATTSIVTTKDLVTKPMLKRPKLPSHIVSSIINIEGGDDVVPYKGIFRASPKHKSEEEENSLQTTDLLAQWKPISPSDSPPESLPKHLDKWKSLLEDEGNDEIVSCWLDIVRGDSPSCKPSAGELLVGETATLVIKVRRQIGTDTRIVSCTAHDGSGKNVQELVDENGCSVDEEIMPEFKTKSLSSKEVISFAPFKVFKFPDHDSLHFKCTVHICLGRCKQMRCGKSRRPRQAGSGFFLINPLDEDDDVRVFGQKESIGTSAMKTRRMRNTLNRPTSKHQSLLTSILPPASTTPTSTVKHPSTSKRTSFLRTSATKPKLNKDRWRHTSESATEYDATKEKEVVDSVEVFNSVEVRAPGIDNQQKLVKEYRKAVRPKLETGTKSQEEEVFCITSSKLLAAFGILITIFVLALLIALYWFVKEKLRRVQLKRNERFRSSQQFSRYPQVPQSRFHGVIDYAKFPHLASPYHRFPH